MTSQSRVAVLIPCYNEEITVGQVVKQFAAELPEAEIYVCDNNSTDRTTEKAKEAGARVLFEPRRGKGYAVQTLFREVEADIYVLVDGDETYPPNAVHELIKPVLNDEVDMVVGSRLLAGSHSEFSALSLFGNKVLALLFKILFRVPLTDIVTGYRAFNHKFVKGIQLVSGAFDTDVEISARAVAKGYRIVEIPVGLKDRPAGSYSKANLFIQGPENILSMIRLFRDYRPLKQ
jgi:glycosyltransferase involved in cell wall biosynthesis